MSFSYDRYERSTNRRGLFSSSSHRSALGYWLPLAITVTAATAGLAAWVWNERSKDSEEEDEYVYEQEYESEYDERVVEERRAQWRKEHGETGVDDGVVAGGGGGGVAAAEVHGGGRVDAQNASASGGNAEADEGFVAQMRGALGRTPSPQQLMSGAKERFNAGVAAVGRGLNSIREGDEDRGDYFGDQERWSEEAESRERTDDNRRDIGALGAAAAAGGGALVGAGTGVGTVAGNVASYQRKVLPTGKNRQRMVAVVVSADTPENNNNYYEGDDESSYNVSHASILSHLIGHVNPDTTQLLILIYAPQLTTHPLSQPAKDSKSRRTSTGSYDKLSDYPAPSESDDQQQQQRPFPAPLLPLEDHDVEGRIINSYTSASHPSLYNALATQAATLVSHPTHILPFTTEKGHVHMLKHLAPNLVYMQESLCGADGDLVSAVDGWIGSCVVVVGAEGAGLVDTETEDETAQRVEAHAAEKKKKKKWWQDEGRVGLGKVEVVEGMHLGEDWVKRVEGG